jgi:hypothetical protein
MVERDTGGAERPMELSVRGAGDEVPPREMGDVVSASPPRNRGARIVGAIAALAVAFAVGWGVGQADRDEGGGSDNLPGLTNGNPVGTGRTPAPPPAISLQATGERCAIQVDDTLWLGMELTNVGSDPVVLRALRVNMPLGGLDDARVVFGTCGELDALDARRDSEGNPEAVVDGSASIWVSGLFDVLEECPAPFPVQFLVTYTDLNGGGVAIAAGGFNDLGEIEYSGCA